MMSLEILELSLAEAIAEQEAQEMEDSRDINIEYRGTSIEYRK